MIDFVQESSKSDLSLVSFGHLCKTKTKGLGHTGIASLAFTYYVLRLAINTTSRLITCTTQTDGLMNKISNQKLDEAGSTERKVTWTEP